MDRSENSNAYNIALTSVFIALAMVLSYIETFFPVTFAIPGIKLGFANIVTIVALKKLGVKKTVAVVVLRLVLSTLLFGNVSMLIYSFAGAFLSLAVMYIASHFKLLKTVGVSILGGVFHNVGQIIVACFVVENTRLIYYLPVLIISGTVTGILIGITSGVILYRIKDV